MVNKPKKEDYYNSVNKYMNALKNYWNEHGGPSNRNQAIARELQNYWNWKQKKAAWRIKYKMNRNVQNINKDLRNLLRLKQMYMNVNAKANKLPLWNTSHSLIGKRFMGAHVLRQRIWTIAEKYGVKLNWNAKKSTLNTLDQLLFALILMRQNEQLKNLAQNRAKNI